MTTSFYFQRWTNGFNNKTQTQTGYGTNDGKVWHKITRKQGQPSSAVQVPVRQVPQTLLAQADEVTFLRCR